MTIYRMAVMLLALGLLLAGCETLRGAERDLQQGSNWFERKVEEAR